MASAAGGPSEAASEAVVHSLAAAEAALLARRREQRGRATFGDAQDAAFLHALAELPANAAGIARASAHRIGGAVYARRFFEDHFAGAIAILSLSLAETGAGPLRLLDAFHRSASVEHTPSPAAVRWHPHVRAAAIEGVLEGFLGEAFNCAAHARMASADRYQVELGEGRDVNRRRQP